MIVGPVLGYAIQGYPLALGIEAALLVGVLILSKLLSPPWHGHHRARMLSLTIFGGAVAAYLSWSNYFLPLASPALSRWGIPVPQESGAADQTVVLGLIGLVLLGLNWIFERAHRPAAPEPVHLLERESAFLKLSYEQLRDRYCEYMLRELDRLDDEFNVFSPAVTPFPPLTTENLLDEKWDFVAKKEANCDRSDPADDNKRDYWDHLAYDPEHRLVLAVVPGARGRLRWASPPG